MRVWVLFLVLLPSAGAVLVEDPEGDVHHQVQGQDAEPMATPEYDLVGFEVTEESTGFTFRFERAAAVPDYPEQGFSVAAYLTYGTQAYQATATYGLRQTGEMAWLPATLYRIFDDGGQTLARVEVAATDTEVRFTFPREHFMDESGTPPINGATFTDVRARLHSGFQVLPVGGVPVVLAPWTRTDHAPDEGGVELPLVHGLAQRGASLSSPTAYRASNGESGVFYTNVTLQAEQPGRFELRVGAVPAGWTVRLPFAAVDVDDVVSFPVELTVPFAHQHGGSSSFRLEAIGQDAHAAMDLGIYYVDPPQPSGHHRTVWMHSFYEPSMDPDLFAYLDSRDTPGWGYMTAVEDDPNDLGHTIEPNPSSIVLIYSINGGYEAEWRVPLAYGLRMGLNVTDQITSGTLRFDAPFAHEDVVLEGAIIRFGAPDRVVATLHAGPTALAEGITDVDVTLTPEPGIIPFQRDTGLALRLHLTSSGLPIGLKTTDVYLVPGSHLELPLAEYHDSIADASGFVQPDPVPSETEVFQEQGGAPKEDSPGLPLGAVLAAFCLALRRR